MLKRFSILFAFTMTLGGCASIDAVKQNFTKSEISSAINERSDYISTAIADWISEEADSSHTKNIDFSQMKTSSNDDILKPIIMVKLQNNGLNIATNNDASNLKAQYVVSEIDDKILIRIRANTHEATRLFTKGDGNSIIPASPLTIRANP
ncbi:MAG: hypothetical protein J0L55_06235 [Caulobacterales bacterium]|nr:hypothetical protein [Caulobacterales bacterium]MCA0373596.1 hypothetical protein [Pseudomonadota bacterium]